MFRACFFIVLAILVSTISSPAQSSLPVILFQKDGAGQFGYSVASAGDVNGDGKFDFIIGAPYDGLGSVYVYSGADSSLLYQKNGMLGSGLGYAVASAGDVNGDGKSDFIVGDRYADPGGHNEAGSAYVYSGADGSLLYQKNGVAANDYFGWSVSGAGDVNGDGKADFIVGAYYASPGGLEHAGSAYVYSGVDGSLIYQKDGVGPYAGYYDLLGYSVASAGDVNKDGKADFIVGARGAAGGIGSAFVYSGSNGSLLYQNDGNDSNRYFGYSVAAAGDVNGDGYSDFLIGTPYATLGGLSDVGSVYVYSGADGSVLYQKYGEHLADFFGYSVSSAGDLDGDGKADFIIGAPGTNPNLILAGGSAYVYSGADGSLLFKLDGAVRFGSLGSSVASAGDVDGDGKADVIISAPGHSSVYIYSFKCIRQASSGIRLTSVEKSSDSVNSLSYLPSRLDSVSAGDYLRFHGSATSSQGVALPNVPVVVYNSMNYNSSGGESGLDTVHTNSCGEFVYPNPAQYPSGFQVTKEGFWPLWFAVNDSEAVPFLLTVGNGCSSCSIDSIVAALNADTSGLFDAVATVNDTTDPLLFPIYNYPANDSNLSDSVNNRFWAAYSLKYFGPLAGYPFLFNPPVPVYANSNGKTGNNSINTGWLLRGDEIVAARLESVAKDMPNYFKTIDQRVQLVAAKDTISGLWRTFARSSEINSSVDLKKYAWWIGVSAKKVNRSINQFANDNWDLVACAGVCAGGILTGFGAPVACTPLVMGIAKKADKVLFKKAVSEISCYKANNLTTCRSDAGQKADEAYLFAVSVPSALNALNPASQLCGAFGLIKAIVDLSSNDSRPSYDFGQSKSSWSKKPSTGDYQSFIRTDIIKQGIQNLNNRNVSAITAIPDSLFLDLYLTKVDTPSFNVSANWDDQMNPQNLNLTIGADKIFFAPQDTTETLAGLALVNAADTATVIVTRINDSTYSATIPLSAMLNYNPGQPYTVLLIVNGRDLFSNYGQKTSFPALATMTSNGGSIGTPGKWRLDIPMGSLPSNHVVTLIPVTPPAIGFAISNRTLSIASPHFLGDVIAVTPTDLDLNSFAYLTLPFDTTEYKELIDSTVVLARFDSVQGWRSLGGTIKKDSGLVTAAISQFGIFGVIAFPNLGDLNGDKNLTPADVVLELNCVFLGLGVCPLSLADVNCDGSLTPSDVVLELNAVFLGAPFPC